MLDHLLETLQSAKIGKVVAQEPLAKYTTIKIGGPAEIYVEPNSMSSLVKVMELLIAADADWFVIGRGSNLLIRDGGIDGVVINLEKGLDHLTVNGEMVTVGAGYPLIKLVALISRQGLAGLEFAGGIPGSVGGAVYMNAGAHGSDMSAIVKQVRVLFADGTLRWLSNQEMEFSYRTSLLQKKRGIVVEVKLELKEGDRDQIVALMKKHKDYRRDTQPWNDPCCGSVFRNPLPDHSGALIEKAGLKGTRIGGAEISKLHGNFIVNVDRGNTTATDVLELIEHVKETVQQKFSISLKTEVEIVGKQR